MGAEPAQATESSSPGTIQVGDFQIQSGQASKEQLEEQFKEEIDKDAREAASKLGKKGAKARKEKAEQSEGGEVEAAPEEPPPAKKAVESEDEAEEKQASESEPEDEGEEPEEDEESEKEKKLGKPRKDPRARMLQATRQAAEAKRERDAAVAELEELRSRLDRLERGEKPQKVESAPGRGDEKPNPADYDDYESYLDARDQWNLSRWTKQAQEEAQRRAAMSEQDRALSHAIDRFRESVGQDVSGWSDEILTLKTEFQLAEGERPSAENWIANELVFNPESARALGLYLSGHPDEFQRIASLSTPRDVSRAMAKLEARLEAADAGNGSERVERSKANPPVRPVKGAPYVSEGTPGVKPGEDFDAWFKRTKPGNPYR